MNNFIKGAVLVGALVIGASIYTVGAYEHVGIGEVGIVKHMDGTVTEISNGWHYVGWSASAQKFPTYRQALGGKDGITLNVGTSDQQELPVTANLNWSIDPNRSVELVKSIGGNDIHYVSDTIVTTVMKNDVNKVTHTYGWNDIKGSKQAEITDKISEMIKTDLAKSGIEVVNFGFSNVGSPKGMEQSQQALATAELGKQQATANQQTQAITNQTAIDKAKADAQIVQIGSEALKNKSQALSELIIQEEAVQKWDGKLPSTSVGGGTNSMFQIPLPSSK